MRGLVCQELYTMKKTIYLYIVAMAVYLAIGIAGGNASMFNAFLLFFASMLVIAGFAYNEKNNWDLFANTMPVSRKQMVGSHYILMFLFVGTGFLVDILLCMGTAANSGGNLTELLAEQYAILVVAVIYMLVFIPIIIKLGSEKARIVLIFLYALPILLARGINEIGFPVPTDEQIQLLLGISPLFLLAGTVISYLISVGIYQKKDF